MATFTKTVVFTDLANYTQSTSKMDRAGLQNLVKIHEAHTQTIFQPYNGQIVKNLGDSFMALFDSATDALRACMDLVATKLPGKDLSFRASAATGDVEEINGDYFGEAVNLSARINSKTPAGEAWFANRTRMCINQAEIPWESVGTFEFKGIPEDVGCFRAVAVNQCILPESVKTAVEKSKYIMLSEGSGLDFTIKGEKYILLAGFESESPALREVVSKLPPSIPPGQIWLQTDRIPPAVRKAWIDMGRGLIIGSTEALLASIEKAKEVSAQSLGSSTVFMDLTGGGDLSLELIGLALPSVPMAGVIQGYSFDLLSDGSWGFSKAQPILRVKVDLNGVTIVAFSPDIFLNGRKMKTATPSSLRDGYLLRTRHGQLRYIALGGQYKGMLIGPPTTTMEVSTGERLELGREPNFPGFTLPDRGGLDRIKWASGGRAAKARQAGLTLDRSMTGRHQAMVNVVSATDFSVAPIHGRIPTYLYSGSGSGLERLTRPCKAKFGDMIVIGTNIICISKPLS
jgi:hypothetical protein